MSNAERTTAGMSRRVLWTPWRASLCALCAALVSSVSSPAASGLDRAAVHGMWVWKADALLHTPQGTRALVAFCRSQNINEVYLSVGEQEVKVDDKPIGRLIEQLHGSGIRTEALVSSTTADLGGQPRAKLMQHVRAILRFDELHGDARFDGIHIDVEPQQRAENKGEDNVQFLAGLLDTYHEIRVLAEPRGLTVNADIQGKLLKTDIVQRRALLSSLPRLTLMLYELDGAGSSRSAEEKAARVREASQKYLALAYQGLNDPGLARIAIGMRTADYGRQLPQMLQALDEANAGNPHYLGSARHSYNDAASH
jgi:hypothetical protein